MVESDIQIGVFYASTTGNTEQIAEKIETLLGGAARGHDISKEGFVALKQYTHMIMGIPTWDFGELQEDWLAHWDELIEHSFSGVKVALFGLGDQIGYGEWFQDAMGQLHDQLKSQGAILVGYWPIEGYDFEASKALTDDGRYFVGLALDEDGQAGLTDERLEKWLKDVCNAFKAA